MKRILKRVKNKLMMSSNDCIPITNKNPLYEQFDIGDFTYGSPTILFPNNNAVLKIGKFCSIARDVTIFLGGNHRMDWITTYPFNVVFKHDPNISKIKGHPSTKGDVIIGNDVWIGANSIILSGVTIGNGAVIAAGSVITKNVGPYELWGGNPARLIRKRFETDTIVKLEQLKWWDWNIEKIKKVAPTLCNNKVRELYKNQEK